MKQEMLVVESASCHKGDNYSLKRIELRIFKGESTGIIFDSVLEKRDFLRILSGEECFDSGRVYIEGELVSLREMKKITKQKVAVIESGGHLIHALSIAENVLVLNKNSRSHFIRDNLMAAEIKKMFEQFHIELDIDKPVKKLNSFQKVCVELIKAFAAKKSMIILLDLTSFLNNIQTKQIFGIVEHMKQLGFTFFVIETFQDTLFDYTEQLVIIKNKKTVAMFCREDYDRHKIYTILTNSIKNYRLHYTAVHDFEAGETTMTFNNLSAGVLNNVSLEVPSGAVTKIMCVDEASGNQLIDILKGEHKPDEGSILVGDKIYQINSLWKAMKNGVAFINENPLENMLLYDMSVADNLMLALSGKKMGIWMRKKYEQSIVKQLEGILEPKIYPVSISSLSPSDLYKIVYCKSLLYAPKVVICIKPFSNIDMHIRKTTEKMIHILTERGIAVLLIMSNLSETAIVEGNTLYLKNGSLVEEEEIYSSIYGII